MTFAAIDFETATGAYNSACEIGIVTVENSVITDQFYSLIQPPDNYYWYQNINVHGITAHQTRDAPNFHDIFPEVEQRLAGKTIVAHNEAFDRNVLQKTMELYDLNYHALGLAYRWQCTCKIYKAKGFKPANLKACCQRMNIQLVHHEALSDALACAKLYILK